MNLVEQGDLIFEINVHFCPYPLAYIGWGVYYPTVLPQETMTPSDNCKKILNHLSRIQGQIDSLKRAVETGNSCEDVALLTSSILRSFDSARASIVETYILEDILGGKKVSADKADKLSRVVSLYKS